MSAFRASLLAVLLSDKHFRAGFIAAPERGRDILAQKRPAYPRQPRTVRQRFLFRIGRVGMTDELLFGHRARLHSRHFASFFMVGQRSQTMLRAPAIGLMEDSGIEQSEIDSARLQ